jgi:hypothetical protein
MMGFYSEKYIDGSWFRVHKSLHFFEDAENETMPRMLQNVSWETIKTRISIEAQNL